MRIVVAGATGLVGRALVDQLCDAAHVSAVTTIGRHPTGKAHPKLEELTGAAENWPALLEAVGCDVAMSALGTTIRDAGSQEAFYAIDHDLVLSFARTLRAAGAPHFLMVSSVGAHAASRNFYLATKGRAEASVSNVGFDRVDIVRPGLLRGRRSGRTRVGERIAMALSPVTDILTPAVLSRYRSIPARTVAGALCRLSAETGPGQFVHYHDEMMALVR